MRTGKIIHLVMPGYLLDQIQNRSLISGRTRAAEIRYLLNLGLVLSNGDDVVLQTRQGEPKRVLVSPPFEVYEAVFDRSRRFDRSMAAETLRMIIYAIECSANDSLAVVNSMRPPADQAALCTR